ncbi:hypothetical protein [Luteolibacter sp. LG18]|uniref:hypothetical protein n=1 Tax=Luteolibacter sp. LG18 TaxID=2819286 RepID=UPI002B304CB3|nr:hypothetical protein llg_02320 [Luteolibacter sp. LG18]
MKAGISMAVALVVAAGFFWWLGQVSASRGVRLRAEEQAVWLARVWEDGRAFESQLREAGERGGIHLSPDEWQSADSPDLACGPVVEGKRVNVRKDRTMYWRPVR